MFLIFKLMAKKSLESKLKSKNLFEECLLISNYKLKLKFIYLAQFTGLKEAWARVVNYKCKSLIKLPLVKGPTRE